ncbi:MAG: hypothetical protein RBU29_12010, partial [bacterium]|nr:hypothetical protein [bacterium]
MKKWLFPSLMAVLVAACSVNAFAAIELTRTDLQYIRIKVDAIPTDPALPDIWLIQGNVIFLKDHYSLESIQLTLEADRLFLDFTVNRGDLIAGRDTVIDQPFAMKSEPLPQGLYTLVVRLNGQILFDRPLDTNPQPQPTPVPPVPVPFYRPIIEVVDAPVTDESLVSLLVRGYLPDTAHAITSAKAEVIGREILLHMEIESSGMGAEVLTMAEQVFPVGQLPAGDYYVLLIINGQPTEKSIFFVQSTTEPVVEPEPVSGPFFKPSVELKTNPVTIEDEVTLVVRGYLPDTAYFISRAHAEVQTNEVRLSMEIESSGIGAQVLVWTEQEFNLGKLPAGMYYAILMINGLGMAKTEFEVHATDPSSSVPEPNNNPYQAQILIDPVNPAVNEEFMIILKGWWPMEGYAIESKDVQVVDHDIFIKLTVFIPNIQTFAPTELVPFKEMLAALQLDYGIYTVHTSFFDQKVEDRKSV